jgi:hypothetical protein
MAIAACITVAAAAPPPCEETQVADAEVVRDFDFLMGIDRKCGHPVDVVGRQSRVVESALERLTRQSHVGSAGIL